jgi:hypothetical protein
MKKIIVVLILFVCCHFSVVAQSHKILYILPDSVELRINRYILNTIQQEQKLYFLLKKDTLGIYNLTVIPFVPNDNRSDVSAWVKVTNRHILIDKESYPLLLDYDFTFSTSNPSDIGELGHREGNIRKMHLIAHRYTIYFKMNGSILKEENW